MRCSIFAETATALVRTREVVLTAASMAIARTFGSGAEQPILVYAIIATAAFGAAIVTLTSRASRMPSVASVPR